MTHPFVHSLTHLTALLVTTITARPLALPAPAAGQDPVWRLALGAALLLAYSVLAIFTLLDPILEMVDYLASRISHFLTTSPTQEEAHVPLSKKTTARILLSLLPTLALVLSATSPAAADGSRRVKYSQNDIIPISAKIRFSTIIILPPIEEIMTITTGDKEFWIINGNHNLCYVHPAKPDSRSNMNIVTSNGHVYSFLLKEISKVPNAEPDIKVFVDPKEDSFVTGQAATVAYVRASEVEAYKTELAALRSEQEAKIRAAKERAENEVTQFKRQFPAQLQFDYHLDKHASEPPFRVTAIYHDDKFTYIKSDAQENPTIYEMKDGKPNLINFEFENGMYIVAKVMDSGYLTVGKRKCSFERRRLTAFR